MFLCFFILLSRGCSREIINVTLRWTDLFYNFIPAAKSRLNFTLIKLLLVKVQIDTSLRNMAYICEDQTLSSHPGFNSETSHKISLDLFFFFFYKNYHGIVLIK